MKWIQQLFEYPKGKMEILSGGGVSMKLREIMTGQVVRIRPEEPVGVAARMLAQYNIGALPVCGYDGRLRGLVTDRDLVTRCIAAGSKHAYPFNFAFIHCCHRLIIFYHILYFNAPRSICKYFICGYFSLYSSI